MPTAASIEFIRYGLRMHSPSTAFNRLLHVFVLCFIQLRELQTRLVMAFGCRIVCNSYASQLCCVSEPNLQTFNVRDQNGILTGNLSVVGVHVCHVNYTPIRMSAMLLHVVD